MKTRKVNKKSLPGFTKNEALNKYANKVLFKDKLKKANEILKIAELPKM